MFIGTCLWSFYQLTDLPLPEGIRADAVFPHFIMTQLPSGVTGLIFAALISAALSSLDSDLNSLSAIGVEDYYFRLKPNSTDKQKLFVGKLIVGFCGLCAIGVACLYVKTEGHNVLAIVFTLYAIFSGGIAGLFALAFRANMKGVYIGIAACVLFTGYAILTLTPLSRGKLLLDFGKFNFTHHKYMLGVYSHLVLFVVGYIASLFSPNDDKTGQLTLYGWKNKH